MRSYRSRTSRMLATAVLVGGLAVAGAACEAEGDGGEPVLEDPGAPQENGDPMAPEDDGTIDQ